MKNVRVTIFSLVMAGSILLSGCAKVPLSQDEQILLNSILGDLRAIKDRYQEFEKLDTAIERGTNFFSYAYDMSQSHSTPLMNPGYFWFKVSLVKSPVEAFDLQPPVLTVFIPRFKKYLKLRVSSSNRPLTTELTKIFYEHAHSFGGTDERWNINSQTSMPQRRGSRFHV